MSTAGKVLIVLLMLLTIVWVLLSAGVSRINTNANTKIDALTKQVEKLQSEVKETEDEIASVLVQTSLAQENTDRERTVLRSKQADLERTRSQVSDTLAAIKYELEIVEGTAKSAQTDLENRTTEHQEESKNLEKNQAANQELMAACGKLRDQLASIRKDFLAKYHANIEALGKAASKSNQARAGSTN